MPSRRIEVEIIGSDASLTRALGRSSAQLTGFAKTADRVGGSMARTGRMLTRNVSLPIAAVGAIATKMAMDYDTAINHVQALTGASAKQTKAWSDQLLKLGPEIGQTPQQLAEALYFVASSGAKVNQVLPITTAAAKDAAAGMGDAQTVAELLTSAINAYGPKALSAAKASDILTESIKVGKAEPAELAQSIGRAIPLAQNLGVTFAETAASVASLTNTGLDAAEAVTAVRGVMVSLVKPSQQGEEALKKFDLTAADLRKQVREKGLVATMQDLAGKIGDNREALAKIFPNIRALTGFLALTGQNAKSVAKNVDLVTHSTGAANKAFKTASEGPGQEFNKQMAQLSATAIRVGNDLLPVVIDVVSAVADLADSFDHLSDSEKHAIEIGLGIAALSGPLLSVAGNAVLVAGAFSKLGKGAGKAGAAKGIAEAEGAAAGFGSRLPVIGVGLVLAARGVQVFTEDVTTATDDLTKRLVANISRSVGANNHLTQSIMEGGKSVAGWKQIIGQAGDESSRTAKKIQDDLNWAYGNTAKVLHGQLNRVVGQYVGQLKLVAANAEAASHDTEHFGKAARAQYAHVAALARTSAQLAAAINAIPSQKYVSLVLSITTHLKTEGLAPSQGRETGAGLGTLKTKQPTKGPSSGTGQGKGPNSASGGLVRAGGSYIVGDGKRAEWFSPNVNGRIYPSAAGKHGDDGGTVMMRCVNWEEGIFMISRVADHRVSAAGRKALQRERMGA